MKKFKNSTAVVTGAGSGIGRALAINLAHSGANLALSDINSTELSKTIELISNTGVKIHSQPLDVSDRQAFFDYAELIKAEFEEVNLVINNAGVGLNSGSFEQTTIEEFEWLMSINFSGVLYGTKAFLPILKQAQWGHIVNISSLFGIIGVIGQSAYNASKFGVRGMTESLRQELDASCPSVSCTSVHPGGIKTNIARNARTGINLGDGRDNLVLASAEEFDRLASTTAEEAAKQILQAVLANKRRLLIGKDAKLMDWIQRHFPNNYQRVFNFLANFLTR